MPIRPTPTKPRVCPPIANSLKLQLHRCAAYLIELELQCPSNCSACRRIAPSFACDKPPDEAGRYDRMQTRPWHSFSTGGLLLGTLFFAASLTPTLLPRGFLSQGVLSGCALASGY